MHIDDRLPGLPGLPENIFKLGADYRFSESLSVGAELIYNSNQVMRGLSHAAG